MCICHVLNRRQALALTIGALTATTLGHRARAQETIRLNGPVCNLFTVKELDGDLNTFTASNEAERVVAEICGAVGLPANFTIKAVTDTRVNAYAKVQGIHRWIVYERSFMQSITNEKARNWSGLTVLAHEIGHHLSGHTLDEIGSRPPRELEADHFAGFVVARLGGTSEEACAVFLTMSKDGSTTHPPQADRISAVTAGWRKGKIGPSEQHNTISHQYQGNVWEPIVVVFTGSGSAWEERSARHTFRFAEIKREGQSIYLFDVSRRIWVKLDTTKSGGFAVGHWANGGDPTDLPTEWIPMDPRVWRQPASAIGLFQGVPQ